MINTITYQWYIGQTIRFLDRMDEHFKGVNIDTQWIDYDCLKYGREAFICEPLEIFEEYDKDLLNKREKYWIEKYETFKNPNHYNLTPGGDGFGAGKENPNYRHDLKNDILVDEYVNKKLSSREIARIHNTNNMTIIDRLNKLGIDTGRNKTFRDDLENDVLVDEYVNKKLSCREIARKYNTGLTTVRRRLNNLGIDTSRDGTKNTTGFYRVSKEKSSTCKQGFRYVYKYPDNNGRQKSISSISLKKLEVKVKEKGLSWKKL